MTAVKERAYAKINLYLDVASLRPDGFHDIKTVMHSVSLYDEITVAVSESKNYSVTLSVDGAPFLPTDSKNLAVKAANIFCERLAITDKIHIKLKKRIPVAAGLAGGSSDAAAVLRALNKIYKRPFTLSALAAIAAELGSDVPYCLLGKTALCEGRGEKITRLTDAVKLNVVIASSGERISTPEAYRQLDEKYSNFDGSVVGVGKEKYDRLIGMISKNEFDENAFFNIFESVVLPLCKGAEKLKKRFLDLGAIVAMMSGSGPSVFAVFKTKSEAENVVKLLRLEQYKAWYAESV